MFRIYIFISPRYFKLFFALFPPAEHSQSMTRSVDEDPLTLAIAPPPNEKPAVRQARELAELEACRVSNEIDNRIRAEKAALKKKKKPVKVLLLGQSESGASFRVTIDRMFLRSSSTTTGR